MRPPPEAVYAHVMSCPDENSIAGFVQGLLPPDAARAVEAHVDRCEECAAVLSELGRVAAETPMSSRYRELGAVEPQVEPIGRYLTLEVIGKGGMGEVRLAQDPVLRRLVALKLIRAELLAGGGRAEATERLLREARAMATLAHPNVVAVYDAGVHGDEVFLAMEYVQGTTLAAWLAAGPHPWRMVVDRFLEAGRGLVAAHEAGILHRDFKPHNVLIGKDGRVRVGDFGLAGAQAGAQAALAGPANGALTVHGAVMGTPGYMAPEQLLGQLCDARADQFSFCVALYEALFGLRPFEAPDLDGLRWNMMQGRMQRVRDRRAVPAALVRVLERGLAIVPAARFATMAELCGEIERAASGEIHLRIHLWCQVVFALCHVAVAAVFTYNTYAQPSVSAARSAPTSSTPGEYSTGFDVAMWIGLIWVFAGFFFLYTGAFWAVLNAIGLAGRRRWARVTTMLYGVFAISSCIGIPYAVYSVWSLTRQQVRASLYR